MCTWFWNWIWNGHYHVCMYVCCTEGLDTYKYHKAECVPVLAFICLKFAWDKSVRFVIHQRASYIIKGHLPLKDVFHKKSHSIKGHLPKKVVFFHESLSSTKDHPPSKVVFYQRISSLRCCLQSTFTKGHLTYKVFPHQRSSLIKARLPP